MSIIFKTEHLFMFHSFYSVYYTKMRADYIDGHFIFFGMSEMRWLALQYVIYSIS